MPKENRWVVRNKRLRAENDFNRVMREFVTYKYGPIAVECAAFYDKLRTKYPDNGTYTGAKKFRRWVTHEIKEYINNEIQDTEANNEIQDTEANNEIQDTEANNEIQDTEANNEIQDTEANNEIQDTEANNEIQDTEANNEIQDTEANNEIQDTEANNEIQDTEANNEIQDTEANNEIQDTDREANDNNGVLLLADNEIREILEELENGNVPLGGDEEVLFPDDEGIHLDLYEEMVGTVEELNIDYNLDMI